MGPGRTREAWRRPGYLLPPLASFIEQGTRSITPHSTAVLSITLSTVSTLFTVFGAFAPIADFNRCTSSVPIVFKGVSPNCGSRCTRIAVSFGEIFGGDVMAAALIDRLVHHCHLVTIRGNSYRLRQHTELWQTLHAGQEPEPVTNRRRRARQEVATR